MEHHRITCRMKNCVPDSTVQFVPSGVLRGTTPSAAECPSALLRGTIADKQRWNTQTANPRGDGRQGETPTTASFNRSFVHTFISSKASEEHVYLKLHCFIHLLVAAALCLAGVAAAQGQAPTKAVTAATATVHGHIADPTGALIPGASITVTTSVGNTVAT